VDWLRWFQDLYYIVDRLINRYDADRSGVATLVAGTAVVANTVVTAATLVRLTPQSAAGTPGHLSITLNPGTGFTITSTSGADTRQVFYELVEAF
jgi:hypothetical protein